MNKILLKLAQGSSLKGTETASLLQAISRGEASESFAGAFLLLMKRKGETAQEIASAARFFRQIGVRLHTRWTDCVDACGTGGDGQRTLNASTLAALVAASGGVHVAKHGNRAASSPCGSSDLLEALGFHLDRPPARVERALAETGFTYCHAPLYQPALARVAPLRRALGVRTLFNLLGPLLNPFRVRRQLVGTGTQAHAALIARALQALGTQRSLVVSSEDGLDEISVCRDTWAWELAGSRKRRLRIRPEDLGLRRYPLESLRARTRAECIRAARALLAGRGSEAARAFVAANAGALFYLSGRERTLAQGTSRALALLRTRAPQALLARARRIL